MTETRRTVTDPTLLLDNLTARRHDPGAPSPQAQADEAETRRLRRRQADTRARNKALLREQHLRLATVLERQAEHHRQQARALGGLGGFGCSPWQL